MIGPFEVWTTARSGERAGAGGAGWLAVSVGVCLEHPPSSAAADTATAARPKSLRLTTAGVLLFPELGPHVPHPPELQPPHELAGAPIMLSNLSIALSPFEEAFRWFQSLNSRLVATNAEASRIARRVLSPGDTWVCERSTLGRIHIETCQIARTVNTVISVSESAMFMSVESQR
jgi:hypothetical protein